VLTLVDDTEHLRALFDGAEDFPGDAMVCVDLYTGDEPDPDAEHGVEVELLPLIAHPRADRRALVAAEVRVMLRDLADAIVVTGFNGNLRSRVALRRTHDEVIALMEAGRVGDAHSVASVALYPTEPRAQVAAAREVRS